MHPYAAHVDKLSRKSVEKHHDAYRDVPWNDHPIDPADPRFELGPEHPLGATDWYRSQPAAERARIGLRVLAGALRTGIVFESSLKRGLLDFAATLPEDAPEFRYAYHEVIEEAQHSLMFAELLGRVRAAVPHTRYDLLWWQKLAQAHAVRQARVFPELFFFFVLGGEEPIDYVQRQSLAGDRELHPLVRRVIQIHVTEEARHVSFAHAFLRERVPQLPAHRRLRLRLAVPLILAGLARVMLRPQAPMGIPRAVLAEAYSPANPGYRHQVVTSLAGIRSLFEDLGLYDPPVWRRLGIS